MGCAADRCIVRFELSGTGYWLARSSDPATPIPDPATGRPYRRTFGYAQASHLVGVSINPTAIGGDLQLGFTGQGDIDQSTDATIVVQSGSHAVTVVVRAGTGEPSVLP